MPLTTMLVDTTLLERSSLILFWTGSENWLVNYKGHVSSVSSQAVVWKLVILLTFVHLNRLINALDCKDSLSSTPLVEVLVLVSHLFSWSVCLLTMGRNLNWSSLSTQHLRFKQQWLNLTTPFWRLTPPWNILTVPLWWIMKLFMTSVVVTWT